MTRQISKALRFSLLAVATGCNSTDLPPSSSVASAVVLTPRGPTTVVGARVQLSAKATGDDGVAISPTPLLDWMSRSPDILQLDSMGMATGIKGGRAWVVVRLRTNPAIADSTEITVTNQG